MIIIITTATTVIERFPAHDELGTRRASLVSPEQPLQPVFGRCKPPEVDATSKQSFVRGLAVFTLSWQRAVTWESEPVCRTCTSFCSR